MKITPEHRRKLAYYLSEFYKRYPEEKYTIFDLVKGLRKRQRNNKDAWIPVCGDTGAGKSYGVLITQILHGSRFDLFKNVTYIPRGDEIRQKFKPLRKQTLLIDEAAKEMRAVNWQSKAQQNVNVDAMTERFQGNIVFMNIPDFRELTKSMRSSSAKIRFVFLYRTKEYARVVVQMKSRNWRSDDPWGDEEANTKYARMEKRRIQISNQILLDVERSLNSTIMDFIIPNLELILPEITDKYKELKKESRVIAEKTDEKIIKKDQFKTKYDRLLLKMSHLLVNNELELGSRRVSREEISKNLGISTSTLRKYLARDIKAEEEARNKKKSKS